MTKVLEIERGGYKWEIDLDFIATNRANSYKDDADTTFQEELDYCMTDKHAAIDWYANNMNWDDVPNDKKRLVHKPDVPSSPEDRALGDLPIGYDICEVEE